jgi:hypothetical protein
MPRVDVGFPWKAIWKPNAPSRVAFFLWTAALGKITADNLRKRNIILVSWCCMCKVDGDTIDDLFLHCPVALWSFVSSLFGVHWVMPQKGPRSVVLLARQLSEAAEFRNLGGNPTLPFVVLVEGKKFQDF